MGRTLVIDCQILQTPAFDRGMGKYTLSLLKEFIGINDKSAGYSQICIILNKNLDVSKERLTRLADELKDRNINQVILDLPTDLAVNMHEKYDEASNTLDTYIKSLPTTDVDFLITAPFFANFAATFPSNPKVRKFSIVYDLIPHKIWNLLRIFPDEVYFYHYQVLIGADHLFTISNAVRDDLIDLVGLPPEAVTNIDGGPFVRSSFSDSDWSHHGEKYILMPSGPIVHKNNERAVRAFECFNKKNNDEYTLYITSNFDTETQEQLRTLSGKIAFTGNISDATLGDAYKNASAVLFPSMAEGLGMPVLEAALDNVPVACSNIPVLSELSENAFYQFDPTDVTSIAESLVKAANKTNWVTHVKAYEVLRSKYTWERSARLLYEGLSNDEANDHKVTGAVKLVIPRPNHNTPAGYLGELLFARLSTDYEVSLNFSEQGRIDAPSYVAYAQTDNEADPEVIIRIDNPLSSKLVFWGRGKKVRITVSREVKDKRITIFATPSFNDEALQLKSWKYSNVLGEGIGVNDLMTDITAVYKQFSQEAS